MIFSWLKADLTVSIGLHIANIHSCCSLYKLVCKDLKLIVPHMLMP